ncbi:MAG: aminotransferase class V-fold PLP-dependent enzyme [Actinobacteria bacterium]|nr:aminotransferase class V-fold PLP-dependent enzyme [Actinomycetota bacterium]
MRARLPALEAEAYLNTGGAGPLPDLAADAMRAMVDMQVARGRMSDAAVDAGRDRQAALRAAVGRVVGRPASEVAIAQSSTHAMNVVIWGAGLKRGDNVVTTGMEHPGLAVPLAAAAGRVGARVRIVDVGDGSGPLEDVIGASVTARTRLVALSHVSWMTGAVLDVAGAARAAARAGALTLVDGAQGAGAVPVDPADWGIDAYAMPAQKWLLGPEGLGALWLRGELQDRIAVTTAGYETGQEHGWDGSVAMHADARRYEASTFPEILLAGWTASLEWLDSLGWERIQEGTRVAAAACREALAEVPGVRLDAPTDARSGLVAFSVPGRAPQEIAAALAARGVIVRALPEPGGLRASCGFFTNAGDIEQLAEVLGELAAC